MMKSSTQTVRTVLRPSMDDNRVTDSEPVTRHDNHIGPLLPTPRHPTGSEANLGGEPGPLASGLGRRRAFHCPVVFFFFFGKHLYRLSYP